MLLITRQGLLVNSNGSPSRTATLRSCASLKRTDMRLVTSITGAPGCSMASFFEVARLTGRKGRLFQGVPDGFVQEFCLVGAGRWLEDEGSLHDFGEKSETEYCKNCVGRIQSIQRKPCEDQPDDDCNDLATMVIFDQASFFQIC